MAQVKRNFFSFSLSLSVFCRVHDEKVGDRMLTEIINTDHENTKYLPGFKLPDNVKAVSVKLRVEGNSLTILFLFADPRHRGGGQR